MNDLKVLLFAMLAATLMLPAGCNSYAQKKQQLTENWSNSTAQAQFPIISEHIDQGRIKEAKELLSRSLKNGPTSPQAYFLLGRIHIAEGRNQQAKESFEKAIELDADMAAAWHALGSVAVVEKDNNLALAHFKKAYELEPLKNDYILSVCDIYAETNQYELAEQTLKNTLSGQPVNIDLMLALAGIYRMQSKNEQALSIYEQALMLGGKQPRVLEPCGYMYMSMDKWQKGAEVFEQLLENYPEKSPLRTSATQSLALCLLNSENYGTALKYYDKLSLICRDDPDVWLKMSQSALGAEKPERAVACAEKALKLKPDWPAAYAALGSAQYMLGEYEAAILSFGESSRDDQLLSYACLMTGRCHKKLGRETQANNAFELLVKKQSKSTN